MLESDDHETTGDWNTEQLQVVAFSAVGLYLIAVSIPAFLNALMRVWTVFEFEGPVPRGAWLNPLVHSLSLVIGLYLFLGARVVVKLWKRLRS